MVEVQEINFRKIAEEEVSRAVEEKLAKRISDPDLTKCNVTLEFKNGNTYSTRGVEKIHIRPVVQPEDFSMAAFDTAIKKTMRESSITDAMRFLMMRRNSQTETLIRHSSIDPDRIIRNGDATIVFWKDGEKTVVKRAEGEEDNDYAAFTAALAIKLYGSNSRLKKMIEKKTIRQEKKKEPKTYPMFTCKLCRHSYLNHLEWEGYRSCAKKHALVPDNATCSDWEQLPAKGMTTTVI